MCGEMILTVAVKCRFCGEVFGPKPGNGKGRVFDKEPLRSIAFHKKGLLICLILEMVGILGMIVATWLGNNGSQPNASYIGNTSLCMFLVSQVVASVFASLLARKLYNLSATILVVIVSLVPCLGLIAQLVMFGKARQVLRDGG